MKQILVLAAAPVGWLDRSGREVARAVAGLRDPGDPRDVLTVGTLELSTARWSHRVVDGKAGTRVWLKGGTLVDTDAIGAVLNRVRSLPALGFSRSSERDRAYAEAEQQALFVSFLGGLGGRVVNGVDGQGALGMWSQLRWAVLAHRCGIATWPAGGGAGARPTSWPAAPGLGRRVTVVGTQVFGARSRAQAKSCLELAELSRCELLGLTFGTGNGGGTPEEPLLWADPFPELADDVAGAVARLLCERVS